MLDVHHVTFAVDVVFCVHGEIDLERRGDRVVTNETEDDFAFLTFGEFGKGFETAEVDVLFGGSTVGIGGGGISIHGASVERALVFLLVTILGEGSSGGHSWIGFDATNDEKIVDCSWVEKALFGSGVVVFGEELVPGVAGAKEGNSGFIEEREAEGGRAV